MGKRLRLCFRKWLSLETVFTTFDIPLSRNGGTVSGTDLEVTVGSRASRREEAWGEVCVFYSMKRFVMLRSNGSTPPVRGLPTARVGAADQGAANEFGIESAGLWKKTEMFLHGNLPLGTRTAKASGGLSDRNGEDGGSIFGMVLLEDGGD